MADEVPDDAWGHWVAQHGVVMVLTQPVAEPQLGMVGMSCGGCGREHLILDAYVGQMNVRLALAPEHALELAAKLSSEVQRVCGKGIVN